MMRPKVSSADDTGDAQKNLVIDVQQADWAELATLPGLGETLARRIVMHRMALQADGKSLDSPEQLLDVPGIGPKRLEDISPFLSFGSPSR